MITPTYAPKEWFDQRGIIAVTYDQKMLAEKGIVIPVSAASGMALGGVRKCSLHSEVDGISTLTVTFFIEPPYIEKPDEDITEADTDVGGD